jgi:hypothetical protein
MERMFKKRISIYFVTLLVIVLLSSLIVYAASREETKSGEPPYGLVTDHSAAGTRLIGVAIVDFLNYYVAGDGTFYARDAKVVFRLRKGNDVEQFEGMEYGLLDLANPPIPMIQDYLIDVVKDDILDHFFGTVSENPDRPYLTLTLKKVEDLTMGGLEYNSLCGDDCCDPTSCSCGVTAPKTSYIVVASVEFAVK